MQSDPPPFNKDLKAILIAGLALVLLLCALRAAGAGSERIHTNCMDGVSAIGSYNGQLAYACKDRGDNDIYLR